MSMDAKNIPELDRKGLRDFGLTTGLIIGVLFGLFFPWVFERGFPLWPWVIFTVLALWALIAPDSLQLVYRLWMRLGLAIGRVTTPIVLGVVFFLVIVPTGLVRRVFGLDSMARSLDDEMPTYRIPSRQKPIEKLEKPY